MGDPLGGFLMSLVLAKHLRQLQEEFFFYLLIRSYLDDIFVFSRNPGAEGLAKCEEIRQRVRSKDWLDDGLQYGEEERKTKPFTVEQLVTEPVEILGSMHSRGATLIQKSTLVLSS